MVHLSFGLSVIGTYRLHFLWERLRGRSVLDVGHHSLVHTHENDTSTACAWVAPHRKKFTKKEQKQVSIKKILKRSLADVGMAQ